MTDSGMTQTNSPDKTDGIFVNGTQLNSEKIDVLTSVYNQFHSYLRNDEDFEHKVSLASIGLSLGFSALLLRNPLGPFSLWENIGITAFLFLLCAVTNAFLYNNVKEMRSICRRIVGFEKIMGAYENNLYSKSEHLLKREPFRAVFCMPVSP